MSRCSCVVGRDLAHHDPRVAELGVAHHRLQAVDERGVAAPVGAQRLPLARGVGRVQIGDDVAAAERIDRLLRDRRSGSPCECPLNARSITCHCTGSVSWNSSTMTIDQRRCMRARAGESAASSAFGEPGQQVVVVQDAELALALLQLRAHGFREVDPNRGLETRRRVQRPQLGVRVADDLAREVERLRRG